MANTVTKRVRTDPVNADTMIVMPQGQAIMNYTLGTHEHQRRLNDKKEPAGSIIELYPHATGTFNDFLPLESEMAFMRIDPVSGNKNMYNNGQPIQSRSAFRPVSLEDNLPYIFTTLNNLVITDRTFGNNITVNDFRNFSIEKQTAYIRSLFKFIGLVQTSALQVSQFNERRDVPVQLGGIKHFYNDSIHSYSIGDYVVWDVPPPSRELDYPPMGQYATRTSAGKEAPNKRRFILNRYDPVNLNIKGAIQSFIGAYFGNGANQIHDADNAVEVLRKLGEVRGKTNTNVSTLDDAIATLAISHLNTMRYTVGIEAAFAAAAGAVPVINAVAVEGLVTGTNIDNAGAKLRMYLANEFFISSVSLQLKDMFQYQKDYSSRIVGKVLRRVEPGGIGAIFLSNAHVP